MAVIYCPDCKKEMSDTASVCPNCGYPYAQKKALYLKAVKLMQGCTTSDGFLGVAELFHSIPEFQDSKSLETECRTKAGVCYQQEKECEEQERQAQIQKEQERREQQERERLQRIQEEKQRQEQEEKERQEKAEKRQKFLKKHRIHIALGSIIVAAFFVVTQFVIPEIKYSEATALIELGDYESAKSILCELGNYKDSQELNLLAWNMTISHEVISAGSSSSAALRNDGTVMVLGSNNDSECETENWNNIISVSAGGWHTVGLRNDGTVVAVGYNDTPDSENYYGTGRCDVSDWENIVAISAGYRNTLGLRSDGTAVAVGYNEYGQCDVSSWKNIIAISAGYSHNVGLRDDGTVVAVGNNNDGQCDVSSWADIIAVSAGGSHTVGLMNDGSVVAVGDNEYGQCDVSSWKDVVAISAGEGHTVGLKSDGTVIATGENETTGVVHRYNNYELVNQNGQCDVMEWKNIVAISAGGSHTIGLVNDGTVVAVGDNFFEQCGVWQFDDIRMPDDRSAFPTSNMTLPSNEPTPAIMDTKSTAWFDYTVKKAENVIAYEGYTAQTGNQLIVIDLSLVNTFNDSVPMFDTDFQLGWGTYSDDEIALPLAPYSSNQLPEEYNLAVNETREGMLVYEVPNNVTDFTFSFLEVYENGTDEGEKGNLFTTEFSIE